MRIESRSKEPRATVLCTFPGRPVRRIKSAKSAAKLGYKSVSTAPVSSENSSRLGRPSPARLAEGQTIGAHRARESSEGMEPAKRQPTYEKGRGAAAPRQFSVTSLRISSTTTTSTRPLAGLRSSPRRRSAFGSGSPVDASCCRSRCDAASPIDIPARMVRAS
jgi:hypothetical protein